MTTTTWITALAGIIAIDAALIGNNAMLVGIAFKNLPRAKLAKATAIFAVAAASFSIAMASAASFLVANVPYFLVFAGLGLVAVGLHTAYANIKSTGSVKAVAGTTVGSAVKAAIVGNAVASIENATVIGMLADGDMSLVVAAVLISVVMISLGAKAFIKLLAAFPRIPFFGGLALSGLGVYFAVKALL